LPLNFGGRNKVSSMLRMADADVDRARDIVEVQKAFEFEHQGVRYLSA